MSDSNQYPNAVLTLNPWGTDQTGFTAELVAGESFITGLDCGFNFDFANLAGDIADELAAGECADGYATEVTAYCSGLIAPLNLEEVAAAFRERGIGTVNVKTA